MDGRADPPSPLREEYGESVGDQRLALGGTAEHHFPSWKVPDHERTQESVLACVIDEI